MRLFQETKNEAFGAADGDGGILRVISSSPTDVQPVFGIMAQSAVRLCGASDTVDPQVEGRQAATRRPCRHDTGCGSEGGVFGDRDRDSVAGRAVIDRRTVHVHDIAMEPAAELAMSKAFSVKGAIGRSWQPRYSARASPRAIIVDPAPSAPSFTAADRAA